MAPAGRTAPTCTFDAFSTRTEYPVTAVPVAAGAVHRTVADVPEAAVAAPITGAAGALSATLFELAEAGLVPMALVAVTVKW